MGLNRIIIKDSSDIANTVIDNDVQIFNRIKCNPSTKEQLKKVSTEFEAIFITKMINTLDKTVDKENGLFGEKTSFLNNFKSFMFNEMGRQMAMNPNCSFGFAEQIYSQMEKYVPSQDNTIEKEG